jgi:hypothetical protein
MNKTVVPLKIVILVFCALLAGAALLSSCSDENSQSKPKGNLRLAVQLNRSMAECCSMM